MNLRDSIIMHEGMRLFPYRDTVGKLTIGIGRNLDDVGISEEEAIVLLENDIAKARDAVNLALPWAISLNDVRYAVIVEMAFNLGVDRLLKFVNTLALIRGGLYAQAADAMLDSKWAKQVGRRANVLAARMESGTWEVT